MTDSKTHSTKLARALQEATDLSYAQALRLVHQAQNDRVLPQILDEEGMGKALEILLRGPTSSRKPLEAPGYDNLIVHRSYWVSGETAPGEMKYQMFELSQQTSGETLPETLVKAVRIGAVNSSSLVSSLSVQERRTRSP